MRSPNSSAHSRLTRGLSGLGFVEVWARLHHNLEKVMNLSRDVQMSCPLLELRSRHVVVFQVKVPQISLIRQFIHDVAMIFTVWVSAQYRDFF